MLDSDLAELYEVETKALNQAVARNPGRFPEQFRLRATYAEGKARDRPDRRLRGHGDAQHLRQEEARRFRRRVDAGKKSFAIAKIEDSAVIGSIVATLGK